MQEFTFSVTEVSISIFLVVSLVVNFLQRKRINKQEQTITKITEDITTDHLTGLLNRRATENSLIRLLGTEPVNDERRSHNVQIFHPVSLMMIDSDFFKRVNDKYGHPVGDMVLQKTAKAIKSAIHRNTDIVGRWGGEEFVVVLVNTPLEEAGVVAEKVREAVSSLEFTSFNFRTSVSIGLACADSWNDGLPDSLVKAADKALYEAKETGRNKVCTAHRV